MPPFILLVALARELFTPLVTLFQLLAFAVVSLFPSSALSFAHTTAFSWQNLIFTREPSLEESFVTGVGLLRRAPRLSSLLASDLFTVRHPATAGSIVRVAATAYTSSQAQTDRNPFITASGAQVSSRALAANFLPLGTEVRIGGRPYTVLDRMNSRYDGKYVVDVWMPTHEAAVIFGTRVVYMEIVSLP